MSIGDLPRAYFAFPGPLRDRLVSAILTGAKTTTTSLAVEYELDSAPLPSIGDRAVVIDSADQPVAVIEVTAVRVLRLAEVDETHARDEGEGFGSVAAWRAAHERYWHSSEIRELLGDDAFTVTDDTVVVAERFQMVEAL
jgi:uncharacterized protein YhfF